MNNTVYHHGYHATHNLEAFIKDNADKVTVHQAVALYQVRRKWVKMATPYYDTIMNCIMVQVSGESGCGMTLGIEPDGYTHS